MVINKSTSYNSIIVNDNENGVESIKVSIDFVNFIKSNNSVSVLSNFILNKPMDYSVRKKLITKIFPNVHQIDINCDGYLTFNENSNVKIGKLISKIGKELNLPYLDLPLIENFVNEYKSWYSSYKSLSFKVLTGNDIYDGYNISHHMINSYMLNKSCMNNSFSCLNLYSKNVDKIQLLVLLDENDRIYGRSLLWKVDNKPFIFMDRVYGVDDYIVNMFHRHAVDYNLAYRSQTSHYDFDIILPNGRITSSVKYPLKVKLNTYNIISFPYMDSFYIFNVKNNVFSTSDKGFFMNYYELKSTYGSTGHIYKKRFGI